MMINKNDNFIYALEERIGRPELFSGRQQELAYLKSWLGEIPQKLSRSTALLSRRKKGKTALVERFFNIIYNQNNNIIPFYLEVREGSKHIVDFSKLFYNSFISQYLGFKLRRIELCRDTRSLNDLAEIAANNNLELIVRNINGFKDFLKHENNVDNIWEYAQSAPHRIASITGDFIVQIIDEFQFLNSEIYRDKKCTIVIDDLAGSYLSLAESKIAPLLVTGSWVSWLKNIIRGQLPGRFIEKELGNLTEEEGLEAVYNYSIITGVPVADEVTVYLNNLVDSDPFYISSIIRSDYPEKDLTTREGLLATMEYEIREGSIYGTWMEYILHTLDRINSRNAKKIILFLSKNRDREWTRQEIIEKCDLSYNDREAEKKFRMLIRGDLISEGSTSIRYKGMNDDIFYKVFRYKYEEEIKSFPIEKIREEEYKKQMQQIDELKKELKSVKGKERYYKGHYLEYIIKKYLRFADYKKGGLNLSEVVNNYQPGAEFTEYQSVRSYKVKLEGGREHEIDIRAQSYENGQDLFIEVKNWRNILGKQDVEPFIRTVKDMRQMGLTGNYLLYAIGGFDEGAKKLLVQNKIMFSDLDRWDITPF